MNTVASDRDARRWLDASRASLRTIRVVTGYREGLVGLVLTAAVMCVAFLGPLIAPYNPTELGVGPAAAGPSGGHLLGTDTLGRDVLSRVLAGGSSIVILGVTSTALAFVVGGLAGMALGFVGGPIDRVGSRLLDVFLGLPPLLIVLILLSGFGGSKLVVILSVAGIFVPRIARVLRGATRAVRHHEYVLAARARGESLAGILLVEILPNITPTLLVELSLRLTYAILFIAALNFLGLGVQPPRADWGLMVSENRAIITVNPWSVAAPAVMIALLSVGAGFIADAVTRHFSIDRDVGRASAT